jgi:GSH-dependent disulfide-bond oxidoreductase
MLTLYTWTTPNGYKVPMLLEELGLAYEIKPVNIAAGEQMTPAFLAISPNNKIPALVDGDTSIFESGAILMYLAEKAGKFWPQEGAGKYAVAEWLMFQMASVGPTFGQANHFIKYAKEKIPYAIDRYTKEAARLCGVMEKRLGEAPFLAGEYSIADMATWPWVRTGVSGGYVDLQAYPNLKRWFEAIAARPATARALEKTDAAAAAHKAAPQ